MNKTRKSTDKLTIVVWGVFVAVGCVVALVCIEGNEPALGAVALAVASGCAAKCLLALGFESPPTK